ncbi:hypothetical protein ACHAW6_015016, partial [Cyclotella cf. meneghiniana]
KVQDSKQETIGKTKQAFLGKSLDKDHLAAKDKKTLLELWKNIPHSRNTHLINNLLTINSEENT